MYTDCRTQPALQSSSLSFLSVMRVSSLSAGIVIAVPLAAASICDSSTATPWSSVGSSGGSSGSGSSGSSGSSSSDPCVQQCGSNSACLQACYEEEQVGQCNAVGCSDNGDNGDGGDGSGDGSGDASDFIKRASETFECSASQSCYLYTTGVLFCLDASTGESPKHTSKVDTQRSRQLRRSIWWNGKHRLGRLYRAQRTDHHGASG